jgi:hypothetical protein
LYNEKLSWVSIEDHKRVLKKMQIGLHNEVAGSMSIIRVSAFFPA